VPTEQAFLARSYPTHTPISEHRVVWSDVPLGADCSLQLTVNGGIRQSSSLDSQCASAATLITQIARSIRFSPGDLLLTGTPHGIAFDGSERWLGASDEVVASIEGLGQLTVHVQEEPPG